MARQLAAFARLRALSDLNLQFDGIGQIVCRHAEAAAGDLLDGAVPRITVGIGLEAGRVFASFTGITATADAVQGDCQRFVRLFADAAEAHRPRAEAFDDLLGGLNEFERDWLAGLANVEQAADGAELLVALVRRTRKMFVSRKRLPIDGMLQQFNRLRIPHMVFAAASPHILAAAVEFHFFGRRTRWEPDGMALQRLASDDVQANTPDPAWRIGETLIDQALIKADGLENLPHRDSSSAC